MNSARLGEFVPGSNWTSWRERLEFLFAANEIQDPAKKRALLFTFCGEETYNKVRDLLHPLTPSQVPFHEIMQRLSRHFETGPSELLGRWRFHKRDQLAQETITEYADALRALAKDCNFGNIPLVSPATTATSCLLLSAYGLYTTISARWSASKCRCFQSSSAPQCPSVHDQETSTGDVLMLEAIDCYPLNAEHIARLTQQDTVLLLVLQGAQTGDFSQWKDDAFQPYKRHSSELSICRGCVIWGSRVVIQRQAHKFALRMLHANHPGASAMKSTARSHFWWPGLDRDIELTAKTCHKCQTYARSASAVIDSHFKHAQLPWHTLHLDFAGPLDGYYYLVVVDAFTKWLEVRRMKSTTSASIVGELRKVFATFGTPRVVVSDSAPNFVSAEMAQFYHRNGVKHRTSAPFHPATNGQAERMVGETKRALKKLPSCPLPF
ncbi:uncharacterized protein LOC135373217 [Ornithodoros turicata]|uniref:uncharacterized protein LOC135373217 n=1 Tax=Ornithodoros turicata TaxID=34597 RepID=UPI00313A1FCD